MKRIALSISIAVAALGLGACEKHSSAELPEHYQDKWSPKHTGSEHGDKAAPAHGEKGDHAKAPAADHKG